MAQSIFMMLEGMRIYGKLQPAIGDLRKSNDFIVRTILSDTHDVTGNSAVKASA
jgi:TetR/AcrR family transcriptional repressor of nem operon